MTPVRPTIVMDIREMEVSSFLAAITGESTTIAEAPHITEPQAMSSPVFFDFESLLESHSITVK